MADLSIDVSLYMRAPRINRSNGLSLARQLQQALPAEAPRSVVSASARTDVCAQTLAIAFGVSPDASTVDSRQTDTRVDRAWGVIESRLASWQVLTNEVHREGRERAAELHAKFFGDGLGFLKFEYMSEHAESQKRLNWIVDAVETDLVRLVGEPFVTNLREAHAAYGIALGITAPMTAAEAAKIAAPLRALQSAIANYSVQVVAWYSNLDEAAADYDEQVRAVRKALAPIDKFRDGHPGEGGGGGAAGA